MNKKYLFKLDISQKLDIFDIVYLDDIFTPSKNSDSANIDNVSCVFVKLRRYSLYASLEEY